MVEGHNSKLLQMEAKFKTEFNEIRADLKRIRLLQREKDTAPHKTVKKISDDRVKAVPEINTQIEELPKQEAIQSVKSEKAPVLEEKKSAASFVTNKEESKTPINIPHQ